jgi:AcrR family transcriptional regulator
MSKAGLVGPFGSRDQLLMAALDHACEVFRAAVTAPLQELPPGPARLGRLIDGCVDYLVDCPFPGGCFITSASAEFDGRPGPLRDRLREIVAAQRRTLIAEITAAQAELPGPHRPAEEVATTLVGLSMAANQEIQLLEDPTAPARARTAMRRTAALPT